MKSAEQKKLIIAAAILVVAGGILAWQFWPKGSTPIAIPVESEDEGIRPNMRSLEAKSPKKDSKKAAPDKK